MECISRLAVSSDPTACRITFLRRISRLVCYVLQSAIVEAAGVQSAEAPNNVATFVTRGFQFSDSVGNGKV